MSSLPMKKTHKAYIYGSLVMSLTTVSFYKSSLPLVELLEEFDKKYDEQYKRYVKETGFEGVTK